MATIKIAYATSTALTFTSAAALANGSAAGCLAVDNGTNLYDDVLISLKFTLATGTPAAGAAIYVYGVFSEDGSLWPGSTEYAGTDAAVTMRSPTQFQPIGTIKTTAAGALAWAGVFPLAMFNGGVMPRKWSIVVKNSSGFAFTAQACTYTGITYTSV